MSKKPDINEQDKATFREAMRGVKPLSHTKIAPLPPRLPPMRKSSSKNREEPSDPPFFFSDHEILDAVGQEDLLEFSRPGIHYKILRKLRGGQYNVEAALDLHGMTVEEARETLGQFLLYCQQNSMRRVLIIHGKGHRGKPILKNKLNHWLRQIEQVLAFRSASKKDGSTGALYVLLRR